MARTRNIDFDEGADSRRFVTALARGLDVLACFQVDEKWLTNAEIAARTGLPKPTVVRLAYTLCVLGYLRHSRASGKYALGDSLAALGITMVSNLRLRRIARPYMQDFADRYDISVSLGIPAVFLWGGARRADKARRVDLWHGDVVAWGGPARLHFHGVAPLAEGEHPMTGALRINLTFRKAG